MEVRTRGKQMKIPFLSGKQKRNNGNIGLLIGSGEDCFSIPGYTSLDSSPEVMTACRRIAELISSMTIHLMSNEKNGDVRINNELSRLIDINPTPNMTRSTWVHGVVMTLLLYGKGNAIVYPHTSRGYLRRLEPISASRVGFNAIGFSDYEVLIDGTAHKPENLLHFVYNPDKYYLWKGRGVDISLRELANSLKQAEATKKGFLESKWKPSVIVKVDAMNDTFASKTGREKILEDYIQMEGEGKPWIIPSEQVDIETIKPLTLADLAISDTVEIDKRTVAAILGIPPFVLGIGEYSQSAWNNFVQNTIRPLALSISQELTKKLILSPSWYLKFNELSLFDWDIEKISAVFCAMSDRGFVSGNEVRDRIGLSPVDGLDEYRVLENYIPVEYSGLQKKLIQEGEQNDA